MTESELYTIEQRVAVPYKYPVHFVRGVFDEDNELLEHFFAALTAGGQRCKVYCVVDAGVVAHWPKLLRAIESRSEASDHFRLVCFPEILPGGEEAKNDPTLIDGLYLRFQQLALDRHSCILVVGGGALLDAVGYAAATAHRGIRLLRMPTTVLSQNDAGVGVKNGVNALGSKNFLGTFAPPAGVINDLNFLRTLLPRDRAAGMAEAVKVALIKDAPFFMWLEENAISLAQGEEESLRYLVIETARLHLSHIQDGGDPFEMGRARPLDFGHWAAHKLETLSEHRLCHGEAVAIGLALDTRYAVEVGMLSSASGERICVLLQALSLPIFDEVFSMLDSEGIPLFLSGLEEFRQHLGGELSVTQLEEIGNGVQVSTMDTEKILAARDWLKAKSS